MRRTPLKRTETGLRRNKPLRSSKATGKKRPRKTRKRAKSRKALTKQAKKRVWDLTRKKVYERDDFTCVACFQKPPFVVLNAHHWINHDKNAPLTRYLLDNLVTLCSVCHLFRLHQQGDAETIDRVRQHMSEFVSQERYEEIKAMKYLPQPQRRLEDFLELEKKLA